MKLKAVIPGMLLSVFLLGTGSAPILAQEPAIPISSIHDLQLIGNDPLYPLDGNYVLTQDIVPVMYLNQENANR